VFERSMHGGLGRGNVGVVVARPGVGKTAMLVQIALDDLLHGKQVLHISHDHAVERVRAYYDELFHDLVITHALAHASSVHLEVERNRLIYSHLTPDKDAPMSARGGTSSIGKIEDTVGFAIDVAQFKPFTVIIDGFDFDHASRDAVDSLCALAERLDVEMWLSAKTKEYVTLEPPPSASPGSTPGEVRRFFDQIDVIVLLRPDDDTVRLELLKEHDNPDLEELHLRLDPTTMRVIDEDLPPGTPRPRNATRFHLYSGGARGAEAEFGRCAEAWGMQETHFSFEGHPFLERERGAVVLGDDELKKGDFSLVYASHRLSRPLSNIPNIRRILQTVWHQITAASEVFVIGALEESGTVRGGTGWGAELARLWSKPVCLFDQEKGCWYRWDATHWRKEDAPIIHRPAFAGIGTTSLTSEGRVAIRQLFERSFGPPPAGR
jgi:hypothetical protein